MNTEHPAVAWARKHYADPSDDDIEIDENARIAPTDEGVWVRAWVYVRNEDWKVTP